MMLGIFLVALAGYLWWRADLAQPGTAKLGRYWQARVRRTERGQNRRATELRHSARMLRELASLLRSGQSLDTALENLVVRETQPGPVQETLTTLRMRRRTSWAHPAAQHVTVQNPDSWLLTRMQWCVQICAESGAPLAQVLDHLAADVEAALDAQRSFEVTMAGPRATTRLLTWLPLLGLSSGILFGIDLWHTFTSSTLGQLSVLLGMLLWLANRWWCRHLLRSCTQRAVE